MISPFLLLLITSIESLLTAEPALFLAWLIDVYTGRVGLVLRRATENGVYLVCLQHSSVPSVAPPRRLTESSAIE
jgi:hypothetical protein